MISKVEKGYINDDFLKDRITLKAYLDSGDYIPCKFYRDGTLVSFSGDDLNDTYVEKEIFGQMAEEIRAKI